MKAPFKMQETGSTLYDFVSFSGANVKDGAVRILVLFYTVNFTTYSSKVDYTILTLVPRQDTTL